MAKDSPSRRLPLPSWRTLCLLTWAVLLLLLTFELWPRFQGAWSKSPWGRPGVWDGTRMDFLTAGGNVALRDLFHPSPRLKLDPRRMERPRTLLYLRDRLAGGLETRNSWPHALLAWGLMDASGKRDKDLQRYWSQLLEDDGRWKQSPSLLSHAYVGQALLEWNARSPDPRSLAAVKSLVDWLVQDHVRSPTGTLPYRPEDPNLLLVDSLGMICPLLTRYGVEQDSPEALQLAKVQMFEFLKWGMDDRTGLPYHSYQLRNEGDPVPGGLIGWGRGTGWLATGLSGMLLHLPLSDPDRPLLQEALVSLTRAAVRYQQSDGCWGWALTIGDAEPDTSTTGMLAWAFAMGLQAGVFPEPESVKASMDRALNGILSHTRADGEVQQSMADAAGIGRYPWLFGHTSWTQGFALLAMRSAPSSASTP